MLYVPVCLRPGKSNPQPLPSEIQPVNQALESIQIQEERQTIVHCHFLAFPGAMIRIWRSTFLIPAEDQSIRIPLLHAENICYAPDWYRLDGFGFFTFSLIFGGLPPACSSFDLREEITQSGAFFVGNIQRNESDVYHVRI